MLKIKKEIAEGIEAHARRADPLEACGYVAEENGVIVARYELTNADQSREHYSMLPEEQFRTVRDIREKGWKPAGVYHSHPETPARMSQEDIRLACDPGLSYLIYSLADNELKSFKLKNGAPENEIIEII